MKLLLASMLTGVWTGLAVGAYSTTQAEIGVMTFGVMSIAFLYALVVALVLGIPIHWLIARFCGSRPSAYLGMGAAVGAAFFLPAVIAIHGNDHSATMLCAVLSLAGACGGLTFQRLTR